MARILVPVRYAAWLSGTLGDGIQDLAQVSVPRARITRLPRGLLIEGNVKASTLLERTEKAVRNVEHTMSERYPVFYGEMGPLWTGTLQVIYEV